MKYALMLANMGWKAAVAKDAALYKGVNVALGKCVYKQVADDLGLSYEALKV
jgi:alanine dehydrogenase